MANTGGERRRVLSFPSPASMESPGNGLWMGYERKRGKLAELNALLRGGSPDRFSTIVGETTCIVGGQVCDYPRHGYTAASRFGQAVRGAMAHPLNRPRYDPTQRVTEGYGILQPRVAVSLPGTTDPAMRDSTRANRASTLIRAPSLTCIRTCSVKARSSARGFTRWIRSSGRSPTAFRRTGFSATIFWKDATRAPDC